MSTDICCHQSMSYTIRRYDQNGRTLWIRDFFKDVNWFNTYTPDGLGEVGSNEWPLCVAASADRVYVAGPLVAHRFGGVNQQEWNVVVYDATTGGRLLRRNVWKDSPAPQRSTIQNNVVDICLGQNGQIGVLTAGSDWLGVLGELSDSGWMQQIFIYTQDLELVTTFAIDQSDDSEYARIEIDAAGLVHLAHFESEEFADEAQKTCLWPTDGAEIIGYNGDIRPSPPIHKPLRKESGDPPAVEWEVPISDIDEAQQVLEVGTTPNGDILAAGIGFRLGEAHGVWGRFTTDGTPLFVGELPNSHAISSGRISCAPNGDRYFTCTQRPSLLCRSEATNAHLWAHQHQSVQDLYALASGGVVTVGQRATMGKNEQDFIRESQL